MKTTAIPRSEWPGFFESFSRVHAGWLCALEVSASYGGAAIAAREVPFRAISEDPNGAIQLVVGDAARVVPQPERIAVIQTDAGADEGLEIDGSGVHARIKFRVAALPDGIV